MNAPVTGGRVRGSHQHPGQVAEVGGVGAGGRQGQEHPRIVSRGTRGSPVVCLGTAIGRGELGARGDVDDQRDDHGAEQVGQQGVHLRGAAERMQMDCGAMINTTCSRMFIIMQQQADRLDALVRDVLSAARLEAGELDLHSEPISVLPVVQRARLHPAARRAPVGLQAIRAPFPLPARAIATTGPVRPVAQRRARARAMGRVLAPPGRHSSSAAACC